jgi:pimeloyl-ACP methyl ester carboxylesterase
MTPTLVSYDRPAQLPSGDDDTRCELAPDGRCLALDLKGYLYLPDPERFTAPYPVLVNNHGSGENAGEKCTDSSYFAERGYLVMVPHRRGHGESTGVYLDEYVSTYCSTPGENGACKMEYLREQVDDVAAALAYALDLTGDGGAPLGDPDRTAIMGHSFGGIVTMFTNQRELGQRAVIDIAGASQSWEGNPYASLEMTVAARAARAPVLYLEPLNDRSIRPTVDLAAVAGAACRQYQSAILPAIDVDEDGAITLADYVGDTDGDGNDFDPRDRAHGQFTKHTELWASMALEFLERHFRLPRQRFDELCEGTSYVP